VTNGNLLGGYELYISQQPRGDKYGTGGSYLRRNFGTHLKDYTASQSSTLTAKRTRKIIFVWQRRIKSDNEK